MPVGRETKRLHEHRGKYGVEIRRSGDQTAACKENAELKPVGLETKWR